MVCPSSNQLSIGQCVTLACLLEATAPKAGNVHRGADFEDLCFPDFVASAVAIGPAIESAGEAGVGAAALGAVCATRAWVGTNTNLGTILLVAPLAAVPRSVPLTDGISDTLRRLTRNDAQLVYEAIRLAQAGGLGRVRRMDVSDAPPESLLSAMHEAAERDLVALQYTNDFEQVLGLVVPWILEGRQTGASLTDTILHVHIRLMARFPDSLIARKCGQEVAALASRKAADVLAAGRPDELPFLRALRDLDSWLRSDQHRRNPGTTADLIAAGLFAALRDGLIVPPYR